MKEGRVRQLFPRICLRKDDERYKVSHNKCVFRRVFSPLPQDTIDKYAFRLGKSEFKDRGKARPEKASHSKAGPLSHLEACIWQAVASQQHLTPLTAPTLLKHIHVWALET